MSNTAAPLPLPFKLYNSTGKIFSRQAPLSADALIKKARNQTGLRDFGDDSFYPVLCKLLESVNQEAELSPLGRMILKVRLGGILSNNLRTVQILKKHPEILLQELNPPIFITGLQRTGTTFLQRLMAADPDTRPLKSWECLNPVPQIKFTGTLNQINPKQLERDIQRRISKARSSAKALKFLSPKFYAIHPVEYDGPEEDVLLMDHSFISTAAEALMYVPIFSQWLEQQDQSPAYEKLRQLMLILQWQSKGKRWILKTPHHLEWMEYLFKTFPEARVIMTHRDPVTTIASFSSMIYQSWSLLSESADPRRAGSHWLRKTGRMINRAMDYYKPGDPRFMDISYYNLVSDPLGQAEQIYSFLQLPFDYTVRKAMTDLTGTHKKNRYGKHIYNLEDYGITPEQAEEVYRDYRNRFNVPNEYRRDKGSNS